MSLKPTTATINESSPRAADWQKVFGSLEVQIKSPASHLVNILDEPKEAYFLDLDSLTEKQMTRLVSHIAWKFHVLQSVVERDLKERGCPILAEDVIVSFDLRLVV